MPFLRPSLLTLNLGLDRVEGARFRRSGGGLYLDGFAAENFAAANHEAAWIDAVVPAVTSLVRGQQWRGRCALALPALFTLTKTIGWPAGASASGPRGAEENSDLVRIIAEQVPVPIGQVSWSTARVDESESAILAVVKLSVIRPLLAALAALDLEVERVIPQPLALHDGFCVLHPERESPAVFVHASRQTAQLIFLTSPTPTFRTVRIAPPAGVTGQTSSFEELLGEAISRRIAPGQPSVDGQQQPARIYLTGADANAIALSEILAAKLNLPVTRCAGSVLRCSPAASAGRASFGDAAGIVAAGLARPLVSRSTREINLLPRLAARRVRLRKNLRVLAAVGAVLAVMMAFPAAYYQQRATKAVAELKRYEHAQALVRREREARARLAAEGNALQQRIAAFEQAAAANQDWLDFMARLETQVAAVGCVWLDRFELERSRPKSGAIAANRTGRDSTKRGSGETEIGEGPSPEIRLSGRILDPTAPPGMRVASAAYARGQELMARLREIPSVAAVLHERFEPGPNALLRFEVTVRLRTPSFL